MESHCLLVKRSRVQFPALPLEIFSSGELVHGMYRLGISVFKCPLSMFCSMLCLEEVPDLCWLKVWGGPPIVTMMLCEVHRNSNLSHCDKWYKRALKRSNIRRILKIVNLQDCCTLDYKMYPIIYDYPYWRKCYNVVCFRGESKSNILRKTVEANLLIWQSQDQFSEHESKVKSSRPSLQPTWNFEEAAIE